MKPKKLSRKIIYRSSWLNLFADRVKLPSGKIIDKYHFIDYPRQSVVIVLTNAKKEILMIKAPRYVTQKMEWELPAGWIGNKESARKAAEREVFEETGYAARNLKQVFKYYTAYGQSNHITYVFLGKTGNRKIGDFDVDETDALQWMSQEKIKRMIRKKRIRDGIMLVALFLYLGKYYEKR